MRPSDGPETPAEVKLHKAHAVYHVARVSLEDYYASLKEAGMPVDSVLAAMSLVKESDVKVMEKYGLLMMRKDGH